MKSERPNIGASVKHILIPALLTASAFLAACNTPSRGPSDTQLREDAARTAEQAKSQSKEVLQDARVAAANAEDKVNAIAAGVKQGLKDSPPAATRTDLNRATVSELSTLPGISDAKAREIIRHRPYSSSAELVSEGILTQSEYKAIAPDVLPQ